MRRAGIIIMAIGVIMAVYTGFNYITREKVVDIGELEITANKKNRVDWSPVVGLVVIAVGAGVFLLNAKKN
jgi:hypothetical protein